jgi:hypothetical protein
LEPESSALFGTLPQHYLPLPVLVGVVAVGPHVLMLCGCLSCTTAFSDIYRSEGLFALWRGTGPFLLAVIPSRYASVPPPTLLPLPSPSPQDRARCASAARYAMILRLLAALCRAIYFGTYTNSKTYLEGLYGSGRSGVHFCAAVFAGICASDTDTMLFHTPRSKQL